MILRLFSLESLLSLVLGSRFTSY